jgi:hypothetical protein
VVVVVHRLAGVGQRQTERAVVALRERVGESGGEPGVGDAVPPPAGEQPLDRHEREPSRLRRRPQLVQRAAVGVQTAQQPQPRLPLGFREPVEEIRLGELALVHYSVSASTARCVGRAAS